MLPRSDLGACSWYKTRLRNRGSLCLSHYYVSYHYYPELLSHYTGMILKFISASTSRQSVGDPDLSSLLQTCCTILCCFEKFFKRYFSTRVHHTFHRWRYSPIASHDAIKAGHVSGAGAEPPLIKRIFSSSASFMARRVFSCSVPRYSRLQFWTDR